MREEGGALESERPAHRTMPLIGAQSSSCGAAQESVEGFVLAEVVAHDLTADVDARGHGLERVRELEVLEPAPREQERLREAVGTFGVIAPAADDVTEDVDPERSRACGARMIDRREDSLLQEKSVGMPLVSK